MQCKMLSTVQHEKFKYEINFEEKKVSSFIYWYIKWKYKKYSLLTSAK